MAHTCWCLFIAWYHLPYASTLRADQSPSARRLTLPTLPTEGAGEAARGDPGERMSLYGGRMPRESTELVGESTSAFFRLAKPEEKSESRMVGIEDRARGAGSGGRDIRREERWSDWLIGVADVPDSFPLFMAQSPALPMTSGSSSLNTTLFRFVLLFFFLLRFFLASPRAPVALTSPGSLPAPFTSSTVTGAGEFV